jgi:hypothetical protein
MKGWFVEKGGKDGSEEKTANPLGFFWFLSILLKCICHFFSVKIFTTFSCRD